MRISECRLPAALLALSLLASAARAEPTAGQRPRIQPLGRLTSPAQQPLVLSLDPTPSPSESFPRSMTTGPSAQASLVPLPPALWTGMAGLGALGVARIARKIRTLR